VGQRQRTRVLVLEAHRGDRARLEQHLLPARGFGGEGAQPVGAPPEGRRGHERNGGRGEDRALHAAASDARGRSTDAPRRLSRQRIANTSTASTTSVVRKAPTRS